MGMTGGGIYEEKRDAVLRGEINSIFEDSNEKDESSEKDGDSSSSSDESSIDGDENEVDEKLKPFKTVLEDHWSNNYDTFIEKVEAYEKDGYDTEQAVTKANKDMEKINRNEIKWSYLKLIRNFLRLETFPAHKDVMQKIKDYRKKGLGICEATALAVDKRKYAFDRYFPYYEIEEEEEET